MSRLAVLSLSMVLLLAAFPLISLGTTRDSPLLWWLGLIALAVGGLIPPARRFLAAREPEPPPTRAGLCDDCRVS
ncbi:MAG TPA: hypothetical protein VGD94_05275 [Vicinamibacterales bacterium]